MCRAETRKLRERRMTWRSIVARVVSGALAAVIACAAAGAARAEDAATRKLEVVWKTAVPGNSTVGVFYGLRLRVQDDNRISLAAGYALVTLDAAGKLLHRVLLPIRKNEGYASVPLQGGDFLVQPNAAATGQMRLSRFSADGRTRFCCRTGAFSRRHRTARGRTPFWPCSCSMPRAAAWRTTAPRSSFPHRRE